MIASVSWIISVFIYDSFEHGDRWQLTAAISWTVSNLLTAQEVFSLKYDDGAIKAVNIEETTYSPTIPESASDSDNPIFDDHMILLVVSPLFERFLIFQREYD